MRRERRTYAPKFKLQLVKLYENGKPRADIAREYDITPSALDRYSVSAMCRVLQLSRNTYYYHLRKKEDHEKQAG